MLVKLAANLALLMLILALVGCGSSTGALKVAGAVSFKGQPVENGEIIFTTRDGQQSVATRIENGKYQAKVPAGAHQVRITAYREVPGKVDRSNPGQETPIIEMYIPEEYNARTKLEARVEAPTADLHFELGQS